MADKLRVEHDGVYYKDGFKTKYIPYDKISRTFERIHEVNGKLCCGSTTFQYFRLVFVDADGKEFADYVTENESEITNALEKIHETAPNIAIGFIDKQASL